MYYNLLQSLQMFKKIKPKGVCMIWVDKLMKNRENKLHFFGNKIVLKFYYLKKYYGKIKWWARSRAVNWVNA